MKQFNSTLKAFLYWEKNTPNNIFLNQPINREIKTYSYLSAGDEIRKIASALKKYNLPRQSHIAILSKNCAHWVMSDIAIMMLGHVSIPIYPTLNSRSIKYILKHSESKAIIIGKLDDYKSQQKGIIDIPKISIALYGDNDGEIWEDILKTNEPLTDIEIPKKDELHTIIYTSGTTGKPKGVMHSVGNFAESINTFIKTLDIPIHPRLFSYLPLSHIAERVGVETASIFYGASISFPESLETFASDLENTQPHMFLAVPRIWCKFQEKILEKIPQRRLDLLLKIPLINTILKNKLKQKLGLKEAVFICSGAAPIAKSLILWFETIGITIHQVYGMTEDCIISHFNIPGKNKVGTVGKPFSSVKIKFSSEGEICIKNKCLLKGYFKEPELTDEAFDKDGFFLTGDIGEYDSDGYLSITGRVKDQFKTDKGKYISPAPIELELSKNPVIEQICIVGTGIPQPIALVTLSEKGKKQNKKELTSKLITITSEINPFLEKHEKIEKVVVMKEDWTIDNRFLTPTLKLKRNAIEKIYQPFYKKWFDNDERVFFLN